MKRIFVIFRLSGYTKTGITSGSVIISEYSPGIRLGKYTPIMTSPSANNC